MAASGCLGNDHGTEFKPLESRGRFRWKKFALGRAVPEHEVERNGEEKSVAVLNKLTALT